MHYLQTVLEDTGQAWYVVIMDVKRKSTLMRDVL